MYHCHVRSGPGYTCESADCATVQSSAVTKAMRLPAQKLWVADHDQRSAWAVAAWARRRAAA